MLNRSVFALIFALLGAALPAQDNLDQVQDSSGNWNVTYVIGTSERAQTFTVGANGYLNGVDLYIRNTTGSGTLQLNILPTVGGVPQSLATSLATVSRPVAEVPSSYSWVHFDLSAYTIPVVAGQVYAMALKDISGTFAWQGGDGGSGSSAYAGGQAYYINAQFGFPNWTVSPGDLGFKTYLAGPVVVTDTTPYFQDFELGGGKWTVGSGLWEHGTPAQTQLNSASSGTKCWMTDLDANYQDSQTAFLTSPVFNFSTAETDPVISLMLAEAASYFGDGCRLQVDRNDGLGFVLLGSDSDWYDQVATTSPFTTYSSFWGALDKPWHRVAHRVEDAAGLSHVQFRFAFTSDFYYTGEGFAIDDISIEVPVITLTPTAAYFQDFEGGDDGWGNEGDVDTSSGTPDTWALGVPQQSNLSAAYSGTRCWMTDLTHNYYINVDDSVYSPRIDASSLTEDPIIELALNYDTIIPGGGDGFRLEMDLNDGNGYQTIGTTATWYNDTIGSDSIGGVCWSGLSQGWQLKRHRLTGAAGKSNIRLRLRFGSGNGGNAEGAAFDDVRIFLPSFPGTETLANDDLRMGIYIDGEREVGQGDAYDVQAGEQIEVFSISAEGNMDGGDYYLVAEIFATGMGNYINVAQDVWISLGAGSVLLQGGAQPPFYVNMQMGSNGLSHFYNYNGGAAGYSCRVQSLVFLPSGAANGLYASSDAFELKFN